MVSDPLHLVDKVQTRLQEAMDDMRKDVEHVDEPQMKPYSKLPPRSWAASKRRSATMRRRTRPHGGSAPIMASRRYA